MPPANLVVNSINFSATISNSSSLVSLLPMIRYKTFLDFSVTLVLSTCLISSQQMTSLSSSTNEYSPELIGFNSSLPSGKNFSVPSVIFRETFPDTLSMSWAPRHSFDSIDKIL